MAFNYPWTNLHELNLNWILSQIKQITRQIANFAGLTASAHTIPQNEDPTVTLTGGAGTTPYNFDFGIPASPSSTVNTVNGQSGDVVITASDIGLGNVDNVQQYSATNPPPYPVTEINGMTGAVTIGTMVDCTADLTPVADLVIDQAYCAKIGQFVIYYLRFTVNSTIGASQPMLTGLYQPIDTMTAGIDVISGSVVKFNVNSAVGRLSNQSILPAGGRAITLSYITAS